MKTLNKAQMLQLIDESVAVLDAPGNPVNPFASSVWLRNFVAEVASDTWDILVPDARGLDPQEKSLMLLYREGKSSARVGALSELASRASFFETASINRQFDVTFQFDQPDPRLKAGSCRRPYPYSPTRCMSCRSRLQTKSMHRSRRR